MVAQPQALAQQVAHRALDRVLVVAGDRLDLAARDPQAGFQRIGRVQHLADGARARVLAAQSAPGQPRERGDQGQQQQQERRLHPASLRQSPPGRQSGCRPGCPRFDS